MWARLIAQVFALSTAVMAEPITLKLVFFGSDRSPPRTEAPPRCMEKSAPLYRQLTAILASDLTAIVANHRILDGPYSYPSTSVYRWQVGRKACALFH